MNDSEWTLDGTNDSLDKLLLIEVVTAIYLVINNTVISI